jgi:predicted permease
MSHLLNDIKYAFRMLRKRPGFTAIALITLAIGIGANTIMFSIVNVLALRPAQVKEPDCLKECLIPNGRISYAAYTEIRENNPVFDGLIAHDDLTHGATFVHGGSTRSVAFMYVSHNYFSTLGVLAALGRTFLPEDEPYAAQSVAVLSHHLWKRQGADPEIVGQHVLFKGTSLQIVGVAPKGFMGTTVVGPDLWIPLGCHGPIENQGRAVSAEALFRGRYPSRLMLLGRLKPGLKYTSAQAQLQPVMLRLRSQYPKQFDQRCSFSLCDLSRMLPGSGTGKLKEQETLYLSGISVFLLCVSGVVLLIACLNLANMLIVQGTVRQREIAIRMAMGGGRWRIVQQLLAESLTLAISGGILGLALAFGGLTWLNRWIASGRLELDFAAAIKPGLDMIVLGVTVVVSLIATVLFGLRPALRLTRRDVITDLKESRCGTLQIKHREPSLLKGLSLSCQIALSVVLVMGAALFTHAALKASWLNHGFSLDRKVVVQVAPQAVGYDQAQCTQVYKRLTQHLSDLPGVEALAVSESFPLSGRGAPGFLLEECDPTVGFDTSQVSEGRPPTVVPPLLYSAYRVGTDYFEAMDIPLLQGRVFRQLDSLSQAEKVVIIDEAMARRFRPDGQALGCQIQYGDFALCAPTRVVGIIPNLQSVFDGQDVLPHMYEPMGPDSFPTTIHILTSGTESDRAFVQKIPAEIRQVDRSLPILSVSTLEDFNHQLFMAWATGLGARLALSFGVMALFLASLGIYAVKGYRVASRIPEIGIRKALGATHQDIMRAVFLEGLIPTLVGLTGGLFMGLAVARLISSKLYGINAVDPMSIIVTIVTLGIASLLAGYFPARRAARIDPMEALRYE